VDAMFNWATLKLHDRQDLDATRVLINQIVAIQPDLKAGAYTRPLFSSTWALFVVQGVR